MKNVLRFCLVLFLAATLFQSCQKDQDLDESLMAMNPETQQLEEIQARGEGPLCECTLTVSTSPELNDQQFEYWVTSLVYTNSNGNPASISIDSYDGSTSSVTFYPDVPQTYTYLFEYDNTFTGGNIGTGTATVDVTCDTPSGPVLNFPVNETFTIANGVAIFNSRAYPVLNSNCETYLIR